MKRLSIQEVIKYTLELQKIATKHGIEWTEDDIMSILEQIDDERNERMEIDPDFNGYGVDDWYEDTMNMCPEFLK